MAKILFHFGAHKTASSHLQYNLELNKEYLKSQGIIYHKIKFYNDTLGPNMIKLRNTIHQKDKDFKDLKEKIRVEINESIDGYDFAILSYEGILGSMDISNTSEIYPEATVLIEAYRDILREHEVIPAYTLRNYDDFVISAYKWLIRRLKKTYKLSEFAQSIKLVPNRWTAILESLYKNFGTTLVWTIEDYKIHAKQIIWELINEVSEKEIPMGDLAFDDEKQNESNSKQSLNFFYLANNWDRKIQGWGINRPKNISRRIVKDHFSKIKSLSGLVPNCMDIDIKEKFQTSVAYQKELEQLKENPRFKFLGGK